MDGEGGVVRKCDMGEWEAVHLNIGGRLLVCNVHLAFHLSAWARQEDSEIWKEEYGWVEMKRSWINMIQNLLSLEIQRQLRFSTKKNNDGYRRANHESGV